MLQRLNREVWSSAIDIAGILPGSGVAEIRYDAQYIVVYGHMNTVLTGVLTYSIFILH
jgi:hypothetical protein